MSDKYINLICWLANYFLALAAAPLMIGIINKVKAFFAGRRGPRLLQLYYDLGKLLRKSSVYSTSSGPVFKLAPWGNLASSLLLLLLLPAACVSSPLAFGGDLILFIYLAGFGRMLTVLAAMETASAFEGMGASRECQFSMLAEGVLLTVLAALVMLTRSFTLSGCLTTLNPENWLSGGTALIFLALAFYLVMLCENCRVPVDDPETHLELTMIHEAMILDNSGPDLGMIHYTAAMKMWLFAALLTRLLIPAPLLTPAASLGFTVLGAVLVSLITGIIESSMARRRFLKLPRLMLAGVVLETAAIIIALA